MALQSAGQMSFADVYNEITGESLPNPPISITLAELGQLQNASGQTIPLNQNSPYKPDGVLPTVFPDEWYRYCQTCGVPKPFLQISKASSPTANAGEFFNYLLTVTNNGETSTTGNVFIYDTIPNNIIISSVTGSNMTYTVAGQNVTITYTGGLGVGQSVQFYIIVKTFYSGTFYNQASCNGGGDNTIRYSNTTATSVNTATYTSTKTERRDRTLQRNDCGANGTGSYVQVWSPYFTNTYISYISQADADAQATALSVTQANNWLDANAQAVANQQGTCGYQYPDFRLAQTLSPNSINRFQPTTLTINIKNYSAYTNGTITITCPLPAGLTYSNLQASPSGWGFSVNNNTITMTTSQQLSPSYDDNFRFTLAGAEVGSYSFYSYAVGGNIANPPVNSNSTDIIISQAAVYDWSMTTFNYDFNIEGASSTYAVPGDNANYIGILTVNNGNSGTDYLEMRAYIPSWINGLTECLFDYNSTYFDVYVSPSSINQVIFTSKVNNIPPGQYIFKIRFNIVWDFYTMSTIPQVTNNLILNSNGQTVPKIQEVTWYFSKNYQFISQQTKSIKWTNNYRLEFQVRLERNPYVSGTGYITLVTDGSPYAISQAVPGYVQAQTTSFTPIWNESVKFTMIHKNPSRDTNIWPTGFPLETIAVPLGPGQGYQFYTGYFLKVYPQFIQDRPDEYEFAIVYNCNPAPYASMAMVYFQDGYYEPKAYIKDLTLLVRDNGKYNGSP